MRTLNLMTVNNTNTEVHALILKFVQPMEGALNFPDPLLLS